MPTLFIAHGGGPCFFMEWKMGPRDTWDGMAAWLKQLASTIGQKPRALVVISAHWEEQEFTINTGAHPTLLYDYYGFPPETYKIEYKAPGSPEVAARVAELLAASGIKSVANSVRGLDHGVFIPLKLVFPEADIPIVQVSMRRGLYAKDHLALGRALAPLRSEGVLIIGSGMSYHNLNNFGRTGGEKDAIAFDGWLQNVVCQSDSAKRSDDLSNWSGAPSARGAHPKEDHLIPLMVAAGAGEGEVGKTIYSEHVMGVPLSAFQFG